VDVDGDEGTRDLNCAFGTSVSLGGSAGEAEALVAGAEGDVSVGVNEPSPQGVNRERLESKEVVILLVQSLAQGELVFLGSADSTNGGDGRANGLCNGVVGVPPHLEGHYGHPFGTEGALEAAIGFPQSATSFGWIEVGIGIRVPRKGCRHLYRGKHCLSYEVS